MRFQFVLRCAAAAPLLMGAAQPVRLQPSSPWDVDYGENSCRLIRTFGEGKWKTALMFESAAPGEMDLMVVGPGLDSSAEEVPGRFLPVQARPMMGHTARATRGGLPAVLWATVPLTNDPGVLKLEKTDAGHNAAPRVRPPAVALADQAAARAQRMDFAANAVALEIAAHRDMPVILETGSLGDPMKIFDECVRDSEPAWGIDPELQDKIVKPVWIINPGGWLSGNDYPSEMVQRSEEAEIKVRLLVDAAGHVTKCTSLSHFDAPEFNRVTCDRIIKRAKFEPAELADGTKVPSYSLDRIEFRIRP